MRSLRIRFAIGFTLLFALFLGTALAIIYLSYADFRKDEFYSRLRDRALTTFKFLVEVDQIDNELLKLIDKNTMNSLYDEKVLIYKERQLIYESLNQYNIEVRDTFFNLAALNKTYYTVQNEYEVVAFNLNQKATSYTVIASAYDKYGRRKMYFLKWVILIVYTSGLLLSAVTTYVFVKQVIKPLDVLNREIENISSENLHMRLVESGQEEEVNRLATNFNQMLVRLEQSFNFQKDFIHYASHELRTPLTAMIGVTETALTKELSNAQYHAILQKLYAQQQELTNMSNSLLLLSDKKMEQKMYPELRLDELVFRSVEIVRNIFPSANIEVNIEGTVPSEDAMMVAGNEPLLFMAINNLLKNAIQYSLDKVVIVTIRIDGHCKEIEFKNEGDFFPEEEKKLLFTPFYRGSNAGGSKGHGLGLPLVRQIADLHGASIEYFRENNYNLFIFSFTDPAVSKQPNKGLNETDTYVAI
jgi:signal transduction histidine kinase